MVTNTACVLVRLFALYVFMQNSYFIPMAFYNLGNLLGFLATIMNLAICILLFFRPKVVLFGLDRGGPVVSNEAQNSSVAALQTAGIAILGLYFMLEGLQGALNFYILWSNSNFPQNVFQHADFWSSVVSTAGGAVLIICSGGLSNFVTWLRRLGPRVDDQP